MDITALTVHLHQLDLDPAYTESFGYSEPWAGEYSGTSSLNISRTVSASAPAITRSTALSMEAISFRGSRLSRLNILMFVCVVAILLSEGAVNSSKSFSPGRGPTKTMGISSGSFPISMSKCCIRSMILMGSPICRAMISPEFPSAAAWSTNVTASGIVMK